MSETNQEDGFDLLDLLQVLWAGRWWIVLSALLFTSAGASYAFLARELFRAEVVMVHADDKSVLGDLRSLNGLASIAGIDLGSTGGDSSQTPLAVLESREFAREFIESLKLVPILLADEWDEEANRWKESDPSKQPDIRDAVDYFVTDVRAVSEDNRTGVVTLSITWHDPAAAAAWANELVSRANSRLRERELQETSRNVKFLQGEIEASKVPSLQLSIGRVLELEMQRLLLARGRDEFAFKVVDPAFEPKKRVAPQRAVICAASLLLGLALSVVFLITRKALRERKAAEVRGIAQ